MLLGLACSAHCADNNYSPLPDTRAKPGNAVATESSAVQVLYYEDFSLASSIYQAALDDLGWPYQYVSRAEDLVLALGSGSFSHVIVAHQATMGPQGFEMPLLQWVEHNPQAVVLISDWRVDDPSGYLEQLGFQYGAEAPAALVPVAGELFDDLPPARLKNPGWFFVWSYATHGGVTLAADDDGHPIAARNGTVFFNGFLSDTFEDHDLGVAYVTRQLTFSQARFSEAKPVPVMNRWQAAVLVIAFLGLAWARSATPGAAAAGSRC